ncbi:hypothetical protein [Aminiphilus circumscriptus]|uniref:hypothetical protein n=1 Tax=Aminiphilus circumscriptus TaxID=290732 RepID=UPI00047862BD|nr:hypothetical protein [Aminiphilus circumscriptus]
MDLLLKHKKKALLEKCDASPQTAAEHHENLFAWRNAYTFRTDTASVKNETYPICRSYLSAEGGKTRFSSLPQRPRHHPIMAQTRNIEKEDSPCWRMEAPSKCYSEPNDGAIPFRPSDMRDFPFAKPGEWLYTSNVPSEKQHFKGQIYTSTIRRL